MTIKSLASLSLLALVAACGGGGGSGSPSPTPQDARNGSYKVFATDGRQYTLAVNFDDKSYAMTGNGLDKHGNFGAEAGGTGFNFGTHARFRTEDDLVVGGFDFGGGVKPFIAARRFVTSANDVTGAAFNVFGLNHLSTGTVESRIYGMQFTAAGTLQACLDNAVSTVAACPGGSLSTYSLSLSGDEFTATDAVHGDTMVFSIARSGSVLIYLRSGTSSDGGRRFRVAFSDVSTLQSGSFVAVSTQGEAGDTALTSTRYSISGTTAAGAGFSATAGLAQMGLTQPQGLRIGTRSSDGANVFVMEGGPIYALIGARSGVADGHMEIGAL